MLHTQAHWTLHSGVPFVMRKKSSPRPGCRMGRYEYMADFYKKSEDGNILLQWDMVPFRFLYDVYIEWYKKTEKPVFPSGPEWTGKLF